MYTHTYVYIYIYIYVQNDKLAIFLYTSVFNLKKDKDE